MRIYRRITAGFVCAIWVLFCTGVSAAAEKQEGRFLFLIETSAAMDANKPALRRSLQSVIESGLNGQMRYGDTIGLWTYNDKLDTAFPMVIWRREHVQDVTNAVNFWMAKQKFVRRGDMSKVMPLLQNVIKSSQKLTIIWISTGNDKITGTPFDFSIDELHKEFRDDFRKQHIPFVTLLAVRKGAVTDFTVNPGDARVRLPEVMAKEAAETQVVASIPARAAVTAPSSASNKPPLIIKVGPSPELVEQRQAAEEPKAQTNASVAAPAPQTNSTVAVVPQATTSTNTTAVVTNKVAPATTNAPAPVGTNVVIVSNATFVATSAAVPVVSTPAPVNTVAPAPALATNVIASSNTPAPTAPAKPKAAQEPPQSPAVAVAAQPWSIWIATGAAALALVGGIIAVVIKRAAAAKGPSFISQSMTRERLNSGAPTPSSDDPVDHE